MPESSIVADGEFDSPALGGTRPNQLRIAVYTSPWKAIIKPTGVGQHISHMSQCLAGMSGVSASILATKAEYRAVRCALPKSLAKLPVHFLPGSGRWTRAALLWTSLLSADRWCDEPDWIYSPKEFPIATRHARLAVTVHDVLPFESSIPGLPDTARAFADLRSKQVIRQILHRASLIATVSEYTRQRLLSLFGEEYASRIAVVGNGVNECYFQSEQPADADTLHRYGLSKGSYSITPGCLTYRKGGDLLLALASTIAAHNLPLQIVITGHRHDTKLFERFKAMKSESPSLPLQLIGYVTDEEQAALMRHAAALLFPSRYEGFGIPVLEAMAAGTPVISSRAAALPEIAGDAAWYVDEHDAEAWLERFVEATNPSLDLDAMITRGRRRAAECKWENCAVKLLRAMKSQ